MPKQTLKIATLNGRGPNIEIGSDMLMILSQVSVTKCSFDVN